MNKKIIGIVGSYRKGGISNSAVSAVLEAAGATGAETEKIYLIDKNIEFCKNCRTCTQQNPSEPRGKCVQNDDMQQILAEIDSADGIVLASPINFGTVTAVTKRFIERLLPYVYWPWGKTIPAFRIGRRHKKTVIITSSGAPSWLGRIFMRAALRSLKAAARCMGATVIKSLYFGLVAQKHDQKLSDKDILKAHKAGQKLAR